MKKVIFILALLCFSVPITGFAKTAVDGGLGGDDPKASNFQIVPCDGKDVDCDFNQFVVMFNRVLKFLFYISIPIVLLMILYAGLKYLTANGDPGKLMDAKKMIWPIAIGLFWMFAAYIVVFTIIDKFVSAEFANDAVNGPAKILKK